MLRGIFGSGGGAPVGGTGNPDTIPRWTGPSTLGDSGLTDDGTTITAANRALSWTRTSGLVGTFNRQDGNEAIVALATSGAVRGYVGAGASKAFNVFNAAATSELVTVLNTGNVGIGTASPGALLDVSSGKTVGTGGFRVGADVSATTRTNNTRKIGSLSVPHYDNTASDASLMAMDANTTTNTLYIGGGWSQNAATSILFYTGATSTTTTGSERARIDSAGNFGIGTTSPGSYDAGARQLVVGSGTGNQGITIAGSGNLNLYFATGTTGGDPYRGYIRYTAAGDAFTFATASTVRATLGGSSLDISAVSGYGLKLPATPGNADTQTLDCYQENTWTPTLSAAATWGGTAPTITSARYTRVGRTITCSVILSATGGAAYSSTWGSTTISAPFASGEYSVVPCAREAPGGSNGIQQTSTVYLPTTASSTAAYWITWTYQV